MKRSETTTDMKWNNFFHQVSLDPQFPLKKWEDDNPEKTDSIEVSAFYRSISKNNVKNW